jgi:elongation factor 1 alpha-like protein
MLVDKHAPEKAKPAAELKKSKPVSRFDQAAIAVADTKSEGKRISPLKSYHLQTKSCTVPNPMKSIHSNEKNTRTQISKAISSKGYAEIPLLYPIPASMSFTIPSTVDFFCDVPWGNVPSHRLGKITFEPILPLGRLLGGSKLAALAAAKKKKKQQETMDNLDVGSSGPELQSDVDNALSILDRLGVKSRESPTISTSKGVVGSDQRPGQGRYPLRKRPSSPPPEISQPEESPSNEATEPTIQFPDLRTKPSTFASTLCGLHEPSPRRQSADASFPAPYTGLPGFSGTNPFAGPSPDDVILRAQTKGAVHG